MWDPYGEHNITNTESQAKKQRFLKLSKKKQEIVEKQGGNDGRKVIWKHLFSGFENLTSRHDFDPFQLFFVAVDVKV